MRSVQLGLVLILLGCAEPAITSPLRPPVSVAKEQRKNSYSISEADRTVHVTIAEVRVEIGEPIHAFVRRMFASADLAGAQRLVIDLRSIVGSDGPLLVPLIRGVITRERFTQPGALILVTGSDNFTPAQNAAALLRRYASPVFAR